MKRLLAFFTAMTMSFAPIPADFAETAAPVRTGISSSDGSAAVILTAGNIWGDGSGYQMLLDADATAYGTLFSDSETEDPLTQSGNAPAGLYDNFEYKIPVNADGSLTTSNIVLNGSVSIQIPAGIYDWCITNPAPGDRIWIAASNGNIGGRADNFVFQAGYAYEFKVYCSGQADAVDVTIIPGGAPPPPTPGPGGLSGDYDFSGTVNVQDAILTLRAAMGVITPSAHSILNADVDENGILSVQDALMILRYAIGVITHF